jgi:hypothetical protein
MEASTTTCTTKEQEKKPVEVALDAIRKMHSDIDEIKAIMKEMKQEFKDLNENTRKGWFY